MNGFSTHLMPNIDSIIEEFFSKSLIHTKNLSKSNILTLKEYFTKLVNDICFYPDEQVIFNDIMDLAKLNIKFDLPYVIITNQLHHLKNMLTNILLLNNSKDEVLYLYKLFLSVENIIAKEYLENYIDHLIEKNDMRLSNISNMVEKNIVDHYEAHLVWLNQLAICIKSYDIKDFPIKDSSLCRFGRWLSSEGKAVVNNKHRFEELKKIHDNLHILSNEIYDFIQINNKDYHIILTYLEKCELISLEIGTELALINNELISGK